MMVTSFRSLLVTAASAVLTIAAIDLAIQTVAPVDHKREVTDGIAQLRSADPETLVIGSSHARTFHVLGEVLAAQTGRNTPLVSVPLENGKLVPYLWLIENRVRPILDAPGDDGQPAHTKLRRLVLLTEWWDSCPQPDGVHWNLPSRAWTVQHYVADVVAQGMNAYNRNYVQYRFRQLFGDSALVRDRTDPVIKDRLARMARRQPLATTPAEYAEKMQGWQRSVERGADCIGHPEQMRALERILDFARSRDLETTVVLFPRMPGTLTDRAKATTLPRFREMVEKIALPRGSRVVDLTWTTPLTDQDFMADFDHVSASGNRKFADWALKNDLSLLLRLPAGAVPAS